MKKGSIVEDVLVHDIAHKGKSVGKDNQGQVFLIDGPVPGDRVNLRLTRKRKGMWYGVPQEYVSYSEERTEPRCIHFDHCGGCKWQHLSYPAQLVQKEKLVTDSLVRIGKVDPAIVQPIMGMQTPYYYRNKLEYSFSNKKWFTREEMLAGSGHDLNGAVGFHPPGFFDKVVDIYECHLQPEPTNRIRNAVRDIALKNRIPFYDLRGHYGYMRTLIIRSNRQGRQMVILSVAQDKPDCLTPILDMLVNDFPEIHSLYYVINQKKNDTLFDQDLVLYHGEEYLVENFDHVTYQIGPKSFFQTNTTQAEKMMQLIKSWLKLEGNELIYDLYTGIGSIALYLANNCRSVVGIEEIQAAIEDAHRNAELNGIANARFYAGDVRHLLTRELIDEHGTPDVLITDPPRAGMHPDVVQSLRTLGSEKILYVSCNTATQARDIYLLSDLYSVAKAQPIDMFPHTHHVENVALLVKKNN